MKLNRKWLMVIALVMSLAMATAGTLAYLTDRDTVENTFTMGNVDIKVEEEFDQNIELAPGVEISKEAGIKNTHATEPAYVWMVVSVPTNLAEYIKLGWAGSYSATEVPSPHAGYIGYLVKYPNVLNANASTGNILESVTLAANVDCQDGTYVVIENGNEKAELGKLSEVMIYVDGYAIQTEGFDNVEEAYDAYTTQWNGLKGGESTVPAGTGVANAVDLLSALEASGDVKVYLTADVALPENTTYTVTSGKTVDLNLNGHTLSVENTRTETHNFMIDVKGGTLNISDGTISMKHTGANMGWNGAATVIDVTAGGVLNLDCVNVENKGGTDMNFAVHLNNWGEVTLNANNCVFDATYCGVRVFNSGYDMNNVKITNSTLKGSTRAFWVHNYIGDLNSAQHSDDAIKARLNLDIYDNDNTFTISGTAKSPIRYGFGTTVYYDAAGNLVE